MKKILSIFMWVIFLLWISFATNINQDILNKIEKGIQQKYGVSIDIKTNVSKVKARKSTSDILFWIDFKKHKMQDFVRESLSPIFTHSDTDQCRNKIKPLLRAKEDQEALELYLKCIGNVLNNNISEIINRWKKVWININTYNLSKVKRKISEIENKEKKQLEEFKIKKQLQSKQEQLKEEIKAKKEMENSVKWIKKILKIIFYIILWFIIWYIIIYVLSKLYFNIKVNNIIRLLDKNLIYIKNLEYIDPKDILNNINTLKEKIIDFKKTMIPVSIKDIEKFNEFKKEVNNINNKTLKIINTEKNIEKKTNELRDRYNKLLK